MLICRENFATQSSFGTKAGANLLQPAEEVLLIDGCVMAQRASLLTVKHKVAWGWQGNGRSSASFSIKGVSGFHEAPCILLFSIGPDDRSLMVSSVIERCLAGPCTLSLGIFC